MVDRRTSIHWAAIALGSNLGEPLQTLTESLRVLDARPDIGVRRRSRLYRTVAVGPSQPDYLNACVVLETTLAAQELLHCLLDVERQFGRQRQQRWGPRTLDLDLLLFDDAVIDLPDLRVPHPRMVERAFVLVPLAEIAPRWVEPVSGKAIKDLLAELEDRRGVVALEEEAAFANEGMHVRPES